MTQRDIAKLLNDNYSVIRLREDTKSIWCASIIGGSGEFISWKKLQQFETKKAAKDEFSNLLTDAKIVEG